VIQFLPENIQQFINKDFVLHSRVHPLNETIANGQLYIKRDDELSSGITGSKYRKFASLIPFLIQSKFDEVVLIGSAQSNNIVGALQLLNENQIKSKLFLLESNENELKGNLLWMNLLHDMKDVIWIKRNDWKNVEEITKEYQEAQKKSDKNVFVLSEGGLTVEAMPGAMTLAYDIIENEKENNLVFDHIFMDSGSGAAAIGLLLGLRILNQKCDLHITLIAGTEGEFLQKYEEMALLFEGYAGIKLPSDNSIDLHFYKPIVSPSFGSITTSVLNELKSIARNEGILMDPVYSVKHLMTVRHVIKEQSLSGNMLFVYSGGSFGLSGFQEMLGKSS
jgi:1-aminocyclopropane-1-carboxylate deaminase